MSKFSQLTVGEIKKLMPDQIEALSIEVGDEYLDNIQNRLHVVKMLGKRIIEQQIAKLKEIEDDLVG